MKVNPIVSSNSTIQANLGKNIIPVHSKSTGTQVYHNNRQCTERNKIESVNLVRGTGGLRLCSHCKALNVLNKVK